MKRYVRFHIVLVLFVVAFGCSRPAQDTAPPATAEPAAGSSATSAPVPEQPAAAPAAAAPSQTAAPKPAAPNRPAATTAPAPNTAAAPVPAPAQSVNRPAPAPAEIVRVPAGTTLSVAMIDAIGTDTNKAGDTFMASIAEPVVVNGKTVLAKGTKVQGRIETLDEPGRVKGKAAISLVLTQVLGKEKAISIVTQPYSAVAEAETKKDALKVGGGAALGALVGAVAGGKKGAAVGAAVGGGAGTTAVLATKGNQLRLESESRVDFVLKNEVDVALTKSTS